MHKRSAQSAVSSTKVLKPCLSAMSSFMQESNVSQVLRSDILGTSRCAVPPSKSANSGLGNFEANVLLPTPSQP